METRQKVIELVDQYGPCMPTTLLENYFPCKPTEKVFLIVTSDDGDKAFISFGNKKLIEVLKELINTEKVFWEVSTSATFILRNAPWYSEKTFLPTTLTLNIADNELLPF